MRKTQATVTKGGSAFARYCAVVVGSRSIPYVLYFELCCWLGRVPGAVGLVLRKAFWPRLFASCGRGVTFAENIVLRNPGRIHLGNRVVVSEGCVLDARHSTSTEAIKIGDDVILANNVVVSCKEGSITIGPRSGIGADSYVGTGENCPLSIGADVAIGPVSAITAGGYFLDRLDVPITQQGIRPDATTIEDDVWVGTGVTMIGGSRVGTGSVVAAGSTVTGTLPSRTICGGVPARPLKSRDDAGMQSQAVGQAQIPR